MGSKKKASPKSNVSTLNDIFKQHYHDAFKDLLKDDTAFLKALKGDYRTPEQVINDTFKDDLKDLLK